MAALKQFLEEFTNFSDQYEMEVFANWEMIDPERGQYVNQQSAKFFQLVQQADLVIVQPLGDQHGCYSSNPRNPNSFLQLLKPTCRVLSFPRMYNSALFPLCHKKQHSNVLLGKIVNMPSTYHELLKLYDERTLDFDLLNRLQENFRIAKKKEEFTDCKLADFIYSQIPKRRVFLTHDHPTTICYVELTRQMSNFLGLVFDEARAYEIADLDENYIKSPDSIYERKDMAFPISDYVTNALGLTYAPPESPETTQFYKNILIHYFHVQKAPDFFQYPNIKTVPTGVTYTAEAIDLVKEIFTST